MPKRSSKKEDEAQAAVRIMETIAVRSEDDAAPAAIEITPEMRAAAAAFGRIGGKKGGPARAAALTPKERTVIASKAARARWAKRK